MTSYGHNSKENEVLDKAAEFLKKGGLVAFPTETVYGIGANALDASVVEKIYRAKGRPLDNPLIVHVANKEQVNKYVTEIPDIAYPLMNLFWPGPLTLIFNKNEHIPDVITGGLKTVGIRVPNHQLALDLLELADIPIAAPSANLSGKPSPTSVKHVIEDLYGRVDMIIDGGDVPIGIESTVLDITVKMPIILRPGKITKEMIEKVIGQVQVANGENASVPRAPGMKYKHYAPKGELTIISGNQEYAINQINKMVIEDETKGMHVGIIATKEDKDLYNKGTIIVIGSEKKPDEIAANLFRTLRMMDEKGVEQIYIRPFKEEDIGVATMNRLLKAGEKWLV